MREFGDEDLEEQILSVLPPKTLMRLKCVSKKCVQDIHIPLCNGGESIIIKGHCNGIICVALPISGEVILCNPAIKEFKLLPSSPNLSDFERPCCLLFHYSEALGFGYDPDWKEYEVINIGFPGYDYNEFEIYDPPKAAVHTLVLVLGERSRLIL